MIADRSAGKLYLTFTKSAASLTAQAYRWTLYRTMEAIRYISKACIKITEDNILCAVNSWWRGKRHSVEEERLKLTEPKFDMYSTVN